MKNNYAVGDCFVCLGGYFAGALFTLIKARYDSFYLYDLTNRWKWHEARGTLEEVTDDMGDKFRKVKLTYTDIEQ